MLHRPTAHVRPHRCARRRALTLAELLVGMSVLTILMGAMGSAMLIAGRAIPDGTDSMEMTAESTQVISEIAGELLYATSVSTSTAEAVTFTVADRGHGVSGPETISYAWSGIPGDPLTRQYNGATATTVVDDVYDFWLTYETRTPSGQAPTTIETAEFVLSFRDPPVVPIDYVLTDKTWLGQYFEPTLPIDAISWNVTRVILLAQIHGANKGIMTVQLRPPVSGLLLPDTTVLEEHPMDEAVLSPTYRWEEFAFSSVTGVAATDGLCLVVARQLKDAHLGDIQTDDGGGTGRLTSTDAGKNWNIDVGKSMQYYIYGTANVPDPNPPPATGVLSSVRIRLQVGADVSIGRECDAQILNEVEATGP